MEPPRLEWRLDFMKGHGTAMTSGPTGLCGRRQGRSPHPSPRVRSPETLGPRGHTRHLTELTHRSTTSGRDPASVQRTTDDDR